MFRITFLLLFLTVGVMAMAESPKPTDWNVQQFGAVNEAQFDNTTAFQKALDEAARAGGGIVNVPTGEYRISGTLNIPGGVTLLGTFRMAPASDHETRPRMDGSVLLAYAGRGSSEGKPFITMAGSNATLAGFIIRYPEWKQTDAPPVPYPPTVYADYTANVTVLDSCFVNSYEAIHLQNAGRFLIRNVHGYPSFRGLYVDMCGDIGRVENCHFWPFAVDYKPDDPFCRWVNQNGVAFEFARTDWQYVLNTFCFGYGVGYKFSESKNGSCNGNFVGIGADSCRRPVLVEQLQSSGLLITNGEFVGRWAGADAVGLEITEKAGEGKVSLNNCSFWGPLERCIWSRSPKTNITAIGTNFLNFNMNNTDSPAVQVDAGKAILQGNTFGEGETHVRIGATVTSAIITGNQASGGLTVENKAGPRTQTFGNEFNTIPWTKAALAHYRVTIGSPGDRLFLRKWHGQEPSVEWPNQPGTKRWSTNESSLVLPVQPNKRYEFSLEIYLPKHAIGPDNGLYMGDKKLAEFPQTEGNAVIKCTLPKSKESPIVLTVRTKGWLPKDFNPKTFDQRLLGLGARAVEMKAISASDKIFDANTGNWNE